MGAEVGLGEGDRERGVGGEVEGGVPFAPVSGIILSVLLKRCRADLGVLDHRDVHWRGRACTVDLLIDHVGGTSLVLRLEHQRSGIQYEYIAIDRVSPQVLLSLNLGARELPTAKSRPRAS